MNAAWQLIAEFLKAKPYWSILQPVLILVFAYVAALILAYEYLDTAYGLRPSLGMFASSYLFLRVTIVFGGLGILCVLLKVGHRGPPSGVGRRFREFLHLHPGRTAYSVGTVILVLAGIVAAQHHFAVHSVDNIRIILMDDLTTEDDDIEEEIDITAFAYLVYELNREQRNWHFLVDFDLFTQDLLDSSERQRCEDGDQRILCYAESEADGEPLIGITAESLGTTLFAQHRESVSVISTLDSGSYSPVSNYEYLMYSLIVQGILIHWGEDSPEYVLAKSSTSHGGIFQFNPYKKAFKSALLAAHLSPEDEELLFNHFGARYLSTCKRLLSLEWLRSDRVTGNLSRHFGVILSGHDASWTGNP